MISLGIVGSRHAVSAEQATGLIEQFIADVMDGDGNFEIVSGGAAGVDSIAAGYARAHGLQLVEFRPDAEHGTFAARCAKRDAKIAMRVDFLLALPCAHSVGTYITVRIFNGRRGKSCEPIVIPCGLRERYLRPAPGARI